MEYAQWDTVDDIIVEHAHAKTLDGTDYSLYRKLSTALAKQTKHLAATLLRRVLIVNVLDRAQSKYYHYALSDLKKAHQFAQGVTDWKVFEPHQIFLNNLNEKHSRKHSFWSKVTAENTTIA